jgi:hypothetical protein
VGCGPRLCWHFCVAFQVAAAKERVICTHTDMEQLFVFASIFEAVAKKKKHKAWSKGHRPRGWKAKSVKQYSKTMMEGEKHPFEACVKKMKGKGDIDNPEAFCASLKDIHSPGWREREAKKRKKKTKSKSKKS